MSIGKRLKKAREGVDREKLYPLADAITQHLPAAGTDATAADKALHAYQAERIPRTARVQRAARIWGDIWHVDGLARDLRNELFARREPTDFTDADWLYGAEPRVTSRHDDRSADR